jgi:hypothetical protein
MDDYGNMYPERAWDASSQLACNKVDIDNSEGDFEPSKSFHKFGCVMGCCGVCLTWLSIIPNEEVQCNEDTKYCVYGACHQCSKHGHTFIATNKVNVV